MVFWCRARMQYSVFSSELAAGFECFVFNKGKRRVTNQRGVQLWNETSWRERHCHKGSFFSKFINCFSFMYILHWSFPYGFHSLWFERCIEEPQVILLQPEMQQMLMRLKPFRAKPLAGSQLAETLISVELCLPMPAEHLARKFTLFLKNSPKTVFRWLFLHCNYPAYGYLVQFLCHWHRCVQTGRGCPCLTAVRVQSPSGYTRNKQNLPCWLCWGNARHGDRYAAPSLASFPRLNYLVFLE